MSGSNGSSAVTDQPVLPKPEGLEGVVAASTALSHVFGEEGRLVYRGYDIHELAGQGVVRGSRLSALEGTPADRESSWRICFAASGEHGSSRTTCMKSSGRCRRRRTPMDALRTGVSALGAIGDGSSMTSPTWTRRSR